MMLPFSKPKTLCEIRLCDRSRDRDLTDPSTPDKLVQATLDRFGGLDIIVNNAGYSWDGVI